MVYKSQHGTNVILTMNLIGGRLKGQESAQTSDIWGPTLQAAYYDNNNNNIDNNKTNNNNDNRNNNNNRVRFRRGLKSVQDTPRPRNNVCQLRLGDKHRYIYDCEKPNY